MALFDDLMKWDARELAKSLAQHAHDNAALRDRVDELAHEVFWLKAADRESIAEQAKGQAAPVLAVKPWQERMAADDWTDEGADLPEEIAMKAEIADLRAALATCAEEARREAVAERDAARKNVEAFHQAACKAVAEVADLRAQLAGAQRTAGGDAVPLFWLSSQQVYGLDQITGVYLPFQREPGGNFDFPVFDRKPVAEANCEQCAGMGGENAAKYACNPATDAGCTPCEACGGSGKAQPVAEAAAQADDPLTASIDRVLALEPELMRLESELSARAAPTAQPTPPDDERAMGG